MGTRYFSVPHAYSPEPDSMCKAPCCRVSEAILLSFKEINLLIEPQVVCLLLTGIFYSPLHFFDAAKCNKTNCICTE